MDADPLTMAVRELVAAIRAGSSPAVCAALAGTAASAMAATVCDKQKKFGAKCTVIKAAFQGDGQGMAVGCGFWRISGLDSTPKQGTL